MFSPKNLLPGPPANVITQYHVVSCKTNSTFNLEFRKFNTENPTAKKKNYTCQLPKQISQFNGLVLCPFYTRNPFDKKMILENPERLRIPFCHRTYVCTNSIYSIGFALAVGAHDMVIFANKSIPEKTKYRYFPVPYECSSRRC